MKKTFILLLIVIALIIGAFAGFRYSSHRYGQTATDIIAEYEFVKAANTVTTLRDLRAGNTNEVFDSLEGDLDSSVVALRGILDDYPTVDHAKGYTNLLRRIADYRTTHPYHSDITNMDAYVAGILTQIKKEK
jgi:hypothetical protein